MSKPVVPVRALADLRRERRWVRSHLAENSTPLWSHHLVRRSDETCHVRRSLLRGLAAGMEWQPGRSAVVAQFGRVGAVCLVWLGFTSSIMLMNYPAEVRQRQGNLPSSDLMSLRQLTRRWCASPFATRAALGSQRVWRRIQRRSGRTIQFCGVTKLAT